MTVINDTYRYYNTRVTYFEHIDPPTTCVFSELRPQTLYLLKFNGEYHYNSNYHYCHLTTCILLCLKEMFHTESSFHQQKNRDAVHEMHTELPLLANFLCHNPYAQLMDTLCYNYYSVNV